MSGERISCAVLVSRAVMDFIVVVSEQLQPAHLPPVEDPRFCEIFKIFMISENLYGEFRSFEPVSPIL